MKMVVLSVTFDGFKLELGGESGAGLGKQGQPATGETSWR